MLTENNTPVPAEAEPAVTEPAEAVVEAAAEAVTEPAGTVEALRDGRLPTTVTSAMTSLVTHNELLSSKLAEAGFAYEPDGDYFYSMKNCWQRECGYCRIYDEGSPSLNMIFDAEPFEFEYGGKRWLIEMWKGQYGITSGGEIGMYRTDKPDITIGTFTGPFYECPTDAEMVPMSFTIRRKGKVLMERSDTAWWLTAFKLGVYSQPKQLVMDTSITFPDAGMAEAYAASATKLGYSDKELSVEDTTVKLRFGRPKNKEKNPLIQAQGVVAQAENYSNVKLYHAATAGFKNTMEGLEHLRGIAPLLFDFMLNTMYGRAFFEMFRKIREKLGFRQPEAIAPVAQTTQVTRITPITIIRQPDPLADDDPPPAVKPMPLIDPDPDPPRRRPIVPFRAPLAARPVRRPEPYRAPIVIYDGPVPEPADPPVTVRPCEPQCCERTACCTVNRGCNVSYNRNAVHAAATAASYQCFTNR